MRIRPLFEQFPFDLWGRTAYTYSLVVLFLTFLVARRLIHSPFGLSLRGIRVVPVNIHADGAALTGLSRLAAAGKLTLRIADTYPLAEAAKAQQRLQAGGVRGRLVLVP